MRPVIDAFKSARLFIPTKVNNIKPDTSSVDTLRAFKFLDNDQTLQDLKSELPVYLALIEDVVEVNTLVWWEKCQQGSILGKCMQETYTLSIFVSFSRECSHC